MSEAFPAIVLWSQNGMTSPSTTVPDVRRYAFDTRPFAGGVYNNQMAQGSFPAPKITHKFFMSGSNWDLSQSSSATNYVIQPSSGTFLVYGVMLEMITARSAVLNGNSFGGQYLGGLLNAVTLTPSGLANGLVLQILAAGVTTQVALLNVNEDFGLGQYPIAGGSLTGGVYTLRSRYEMRQPLIAGTSDAVTWKVQDDMTGRGISELRAIAYGAAL